MSKVLRRRVFVDLSTLAADGSNGGSRVFVVRLLRGLLEGPQAPEIHLLVKPVAETVVAPLIASGATLHRLGRGLDVEEPRRLLRFRRRLPRGLRLLPDRASLRHRGADVLFSPLATAWFHEPSLPHVAVVYDFQELHFPRFFDKTELRRRREFRSDLARADRVAAISHATRGDAITVGGIPASRVTVIPPVAGEIRMRLAEAEVGSRLAALHLSRGDYALYPANFWPHKNHGRLLAAVALVPRSEPGFRLVLCGALDDARARLEGVVAGRGLSEAVRVLPYVSDEDVTALIQGARFLAFPSLFEGFGIPVLEALHLGTPVTCSELPALREVAGEAALYFDPNDDTSLADALEILWKSPETRGRLAASGHARAERFARLDTVGAYRRLLTFE
jgi:glycosyltransferase involved in cell wall biosynthesis